MKFVMLCGVLLVLASALLVPGPAVGQASAPAPGTTMVDSNTGVTLAYIPAGTFIMGDDRPRDFSYNNDTRPRKVTLSKPFWMGTTEVTNAQYRRFVEATGRQEPGYWGNSKYNAPKQPVVGVSWNDAMAYAKWAGMSLPTEAQWEYAARAGTTTRYWSGASEEDLTRVDWVWSNSNRDSTDYAIGLRFENAWGLHDVGEKPANAWGLHDVHGNAAEWTADWYGEPQRKPETDPTGPEYGLLARLHYQLIRGIPPGRVVRGGTSLSKVETTKRELTAPDTRHYYIGFRVVKTIP